MTKEVSREAHLLFFLGEVRYTEELAHAQKGGSFA